MLFFFNISAICILFSTSQFRLRFDCNKSVTFLWSTTIVSYLWQMFYWRPGYRYIGIKPEATPTMWWRVLDTLCTIVKAHTNCFLSDYENCTFYEFLHRTLSPFIFSHFLASYIYNGLFEGLSFLYYWSCLVKS